MNTGWTSKKDVDAREGVRTEGKGVRLEDFGFWVILPERFGRGAPKIDTPPDFEPRLSEALRKPSRAAKNIPHRQGNFGRLNAWHDW
jgi:hypothetical protein